MSWHFLFVPIVTILVMIPMILGIVPLNGVYGFRLGKTMSSPDIWYKANRIAGLYIVAASVVSIGIHAFLMDKARPGLALTLSHISFVMLLLTAMVLAYLQVKRM